MSATPDLRRRTVLRVGGAAAAALWVAPVVQVVGVSAASADDPSGGACKVPSHAVVVVRYEGREYGLKIEGAGDGTWESVGGNPHDLAALRTAGWIAQDGTKRYSKPGSSLVRLMSRADHTEIGACDITFQPPLGVTVLYAHVFDANTVLPADQTASGWRFVGINGRGA